MIILRILAVNVAMIVGRWEGKEKRSWIWLGRWARCVKLTRGEDLHPVQVFAVVEFDAQQRQRDNARDHLRTQRVVKRINV